MCLSTTSVLAYLRPTFSFLSLQGVADYALDHAANPVAAAPQPETRGEVSMEIQQLGDQNKGTESTNISDT